MRFAVAPFASGYGVFLFLNRKRPAGAPDITNSGDTNSGDTNSGHTHSGHPHSGDTHSGHPHSGHTHSYLEMRRLTGFCRPRDSGRSTGAPPAPGRPINRPASRLTHHSAATN